MPWPIADWWTYRDFERFDTHWRPRFIPDDSRPAAAWLASILEVVLDEPFLPGAGATSSKRLRPLLERIANESPHRIARKVLRSSVLSCAVRLTAPEIVGGLEPVDIFSDRVVKALLKDSQLLDEVRRVRAWYFEGLWPRDGGARPPGLPLYGRVAPKLAMEQVDELLRSLGPRIPDPQLRVFAESLQNAKGNLTKYREVIDSYSPFTEPTTGVTADLLGSELRAGLEVLAQRDPFHVAFGEAFDPTLADFASVRKR